MATLKPVFAFIAGAVFLFILPASVMLQQSGAPAKRTGAPGDGDGTQGNSGSCADVGCHNSFDINSGPGSVTIEAPDEFVPGVPVDFIVSVHDTTRFRFGFQVTIKNDAAENVGSFELIDGSTRFATGNEDYVTHTLANSLSTWTVRWNPPEELTDDVTIYAAGNAADNRFTAANDYVYETSEPLLYSVTSGIDDIPTAPSIRGLTVYPNPASSAATVAFDVGDTSDLEISLYNSLGQKVRSLSHRTWLPGSYIETVQLTGLPAGVYFVQLQDERGSISRPLSVTR